MKMVDTRTLTSLALSIALFSLAYTQSKTASQPKKAEARIETPSSDPLPEKQEAKQRLQAALVQVRQQIAQQQRKIDGEAMRHAQANLESDFGPLNSATEDEQNQKLLLQLGHKEKQILAALKGQ